jgi:hypothetical protein
MANVMKYLKRFNESKIIDTSSHELFISKLEDFCEESLAYLLDEGYYFNISDNGDYSKIRFTFRGKNIIWDDIKDDFSPFLELLREKYDIDNRETEEVLIWARPEKKSDGSHYYFSIDELLNDEMENCGYPNFRPDLIRTIEIDVLNSEK